MTVQGEPIPVRGSLSDVTMETGKIADCLGHTVGMSVQELGIAGLSDPAYPLTLVALQQEGIGWCWIYARDGIPYGIEWVSYDLGDSQTVETALTYSVENGMITAIRTRVHEMTAEEAMANLSSVAELDAAQRASARAERNAMTAFEAGDALLNGTKVIYAASEQLARLLGDPVSSHNLPSGQGRLLMYDGLIAAVNLEEQTGVETIYGLTVVSDAYTGPRNIRVGMTLKETTGLFRCDRTVTSAGGTLYESDADSRLPQAKLLRFEGGEETLIYGCESGSITLWLEITFQSGRINAWRLYTGNQDNGRLSSGNL